MITCDCDQLRFCRVEWYCSLASFQYQSTGVDSSPSLGKIELMRSVRGLFLSTYGTFRWPGTYKIFLLEISIKVRGTATSKKTKNKQNTS